jgi:GNAT superfamily N-acetyltransferase
MTVEIRAARDDDYADFVRLFGELAIPDPLPSAERFAAGIVPVMSVATLDDQVVGFVTWRRYSELAHVMQLAVDRHVRGQRIGQRLLEHARDAARAAGCTRWYLNVKRDNTAAIRLYERCGLAFELESTLVNLDWADIPRVDGVTEILASADEDAEIAARFAVPLARIQMFRARDNRMITLRDEAGALLAFAPFAPEFPGTPMLHAARPDLAPALVEAIRHHADPRFDFVRLCVEGDRALTDALFALGGKLVFEILRLSAPTT